MVLDGGLLFSADWLGPSFQILCSLPLANTQVSSRVALEKLNMTGSNMGLFKKL